MQGGVGQVVTYDVVTGKYTGMAKKMMDQVVNS